MVAVTQSSVDEIFEVLVAMNDVMKQESGCASAGMLSLGVVSPTTVGDMARGAMTRVANSFTTRRRYCSL